MNHISIDRANERIKAFLQSLPVDSDGAVLELDGQPLLRVFPASAESDLRKALFQRGRELVQRARSRNQHIAPEKIEQDVFEAIEEVRDRKAV